MRLALVAGTALLALAAQAVPLPQEVVVTKASDNRTLTVRYAGAKASLIELRLNGKSLSTRTVNVQATSGETNFTLETAKLDDGDNNLEIRLLDADGKVLAVEKTVVTVDRSATGPIYLAKPSAGESVQGFVEISVGFQHQIKNAYVSFFVDDQFKSLRNYAPYAYLWDTSKATNGWHEVEAWVVDESSNTFKTQRLRVFVNNPGGRTERLADPIGNAPSTPRAPVATPKVNAPKANAPVALDVTAGAPVLATSKPSGSKAVGVGHGTMTDLRVMRPTGERIAGAKPTNGPANAPKVKLASPRSTSPRVGTLPKAGNVVAVNAPKVSKPAPVKPNVAKTNAPVPTAPKAPSLIELSYGTKLSASGTFDVFVNGSRVDFDVSPRFEAGIPLAPFRHMFEHMGAEVCWTNTTKSVAAKGLGHDVRFVIGQDYATVNGGRVGLERASFLEKGRAIVPLSLMQRVLDVNVNFDPATKHVLVTKASK